ncbi:hypothetical protein Trydic_g1309 [Trypoxylus dichotomus]
MEASLFSWRGIPYAKPPVKDLRFEPPEEPENWAGVRDATEDSSECIQTPVSELPNSLVTPQGQEDCLYINVYSPKLPENDSRLLAVLVFIHGGAFTEGNSSYNTYGPDQLVSKGVICVTFNYRLGIFGFLTTGDDAAPGNFGLKDQIRALKWIQRNIQAFGGDPGNVTLFGESAGSVSISILLTSPLTRGLYTGAILESGCALCQWGTTKVGRTASYSTGLLLNIPALNSYSLVKGLKRVPAVDLHRASVTVMSNLLIQQRLNGPVFAPTIEHLHDGAVLNGCYYQSLKNGRFNQVPLIIGYNSAEAYWFTDVIQLLSPLAVMYDVFPTFLVPDSMRADPIDRVIVGRKIQEHYGLMSSRPNNISKYTSDNQFCRPIQKMASLVSKFVKTFLYVFSYTRNPNQIGAPHTAELKYLFNSQYNSTNDRNVKDCMTTLWTNFAKHKNPTPPGYINCGRKWKPTEPNSRNNLFYLDIGINLSAITATALGQKMTVPFASLILSSLLGIGLCQVQLLQVETQNGWVVGQQLNNMYSWRGIPYARPPIKNLRFQPPQTPNNWTGIWDATYDRSECVQVALTDATEKSRIPRLSELIPQGDEDCLYINVYTPQLPQTNATLLPVMVWIHGGAFMEGNGSYTLYAPDSLVQQGVVVVTLNYRLGIFGFLSTADSAALENVGLRDQIFALQWVQNNIINFGGDPNKVTIFGESAGSASVSYLVLSPLTNGLFRGAIMESGTALCLWSLSRTAKDATYALLAELGLVALTSKLLVSVLRAVPAYQLQIAAMTVAGTFLAMDPLNGLTFAPVIETASSTAVITDSSYAKLLQGNFNKVPQIIGYNSAESLFFKGVTNIFAMYLPTYDLVSSRLVPSSMKAGIFNLPAIGSTIRRHYAGPFGVISYPNNNMAKYITDNEFIRPIIETSNLTSQYVSTYLYRFSYNHDSDTIGASHTDEMKYLFNTNYNDATDEIIRTCITSLWSNFAKFLNPTPAGTNVCGGITWTAMGPPDRRTSYYLDIDRTVTTGQNPNQDEMNFWQGLFKEYANPPLKTY